MASEFAVKVESVLERYGRQKDNLIAILSTARRSSPTCRGKSWSRSPTVSAHRHRRYSGSPPSSSGSA